MMIKRADSWMWDHGVTPAAVVPVHSRGLDRDWMVKRAVAGLFSNLNLQPEPDHSLIHLIAMGDSEFYGGNRNGDLYYGGGRRLDIPYPDWDRVLLKKANADKSPRYHEKSSETFSDRIHTGNDTRYKTFATHAFVFKDHLNKPYPHTDKDGKKQEPHKIHGTVKAAAHNSDLHRVELMIQVPHDRSWNADLEKLANDDDVPFSMSCKVPYDVCLLCGHKAAGPDDYCPHVANHMTAIDKSGHFVGVANDYMTYFDISRVGRPADRIAWSLYGINGEHGSEKSASADEEPAPRLDNRIRLTLENFLSKAAAFEKQMEMTAFLGDKRRRRGFKARENGPEIKFASANIGQEVLELSVAGVCLPVEQWAKAVYGSNAANLPIKEAQERLPGVFSRHKEDLIKLAGFYTADFHSRPSQYNRNAWEARQAWGLDTEIVARRALSDALDNSEITIKSASAASVDMDHSAERLAAHYAGYQLAFAEAASRTRSDAGILMESVVTRNFL